MNTNMIQPKIDTEDLLFSTTKTCERLIKQTHTKPQEKLDFKINKWRENFSINLLLILVSFPTRWLD